MNLNFKQAIFCYSLIHSAIITLASLTNQCLQAAIDATPRAKEAAAALLQKQKEEEAAAALLQKQKEEDWRRLVNDNREDIDDMKSLLSRIGFSKGESQKYAELLVLKHKVNSETKFQRKVGSDIAGYSAILQLRTDDVELLKEYFKRHMNVSTPLPPPPPLSSPGTTANSSVASAGGGATMQTPSHWSCFMVLSSPLDLVHASRLTCSSLT